MDQRIDSLCDGGRIDERIEDCNEGSVDNRVEHSEAFVDRRTDERSEG